MPNRTLIVVITAALLAVAFWYVRVHEPTGQSATDERNVAEVAAFETDISSISQNSLPLVEESLVTLPEPVYCVGTGTDEIVAHPLFAAEMRRLLPLLEIPDLSAYYSQNVADLEALANSADASAMIMLAVHEMRLMRGEEDLVIDENSAYELLHLSAQTTLDARQIDHVDRASYWLYEAGLNGSLRAFDILHRIEYARYGGPIRQELVVADSNWSEREIESIDYYLAHYVNQEVFWNLHVELQSGLANYVHVNSPTRFMRREAIKELSEHRQVRQLVVEKAQIIQNDIASTGIPAVKLPPPEFEFEDALAAICGEDFEIPELQN